MRRILLPLVAGLLVALVLPASATPYYVDEGYCNEYDPERDLMYWCTPNGDFYTPEGEDPLWYGPEGSGDNPYAAPLDDPAAGSVARDPSWQEGGSIPPPAPYDANKDYCSEPWWGDPPWEDEVWNPPCYRHDVCYGSQLGRKYCDVRFWRDMERACRDGYPPWLPHARYACLADARIWYWMVREYGASNYQPRMSSLEP